MKFVAVDQHDGEAIILEDKEDLSEFARGRSLKHWIIYELGPEIKVRVTTTVEVLKKV